MMNSLKYIKFCKSTMPWKVYQTLKRSYELGSPRRFFFLLPYDLFPRFQYPSRLSISLTTRCNLRCFICRREGFKGTDMKFENIYKLERAIKYASEISLTGWGEAMLHPRFEHFLQYIYSVNSSKNLIQITTNGTLLSRKKAELLTGHIKTLSVSLNAATEKTYNRDMKNGDFLKTLNAVEEFLWSLERSERKKINLHFVAHAKNFYELPEFVSLAKRLGITSVSIGHYLVASPAHSQFSLFQVKNEYSKLVDRTVALGKELDVNVSVPRRFLGEKKRSPKECLSPFNEAILDVNGDLRPCCFCGTFCIGNAYEESFENVWFSNEYRMLRKTKNLRGCQNCSNLIPLDAFDSHFTSRFKETSEFEFLKRDFAKTQNKNA
jgi:MoaA/NifB/PqqE/SkfB family radical SAM enzyme